MRGLIAVFVTIIGGLFITAGLVPVSAEEVPRDHKIIICHRTNAVKNPYVVLTIDRNAADGIAGNSGKEPDHYGEHQGQLASSSTVAQSLKDEKSEWGDIIPPIPGVHLGQNWTTEGQAIYNNDCNYVDETEGAVADVSVEPATCEVGETLVYGEIENATFSGTDNGTTGPATYSVTATAIDDALFEGDVAVMNFPEVGEGTLDGPLTGEECVLGETSPSINYSVVCSTDADGHVAVTFTNTGDADGEATLNGEVIAIASGATIEKTIALTNGSADVTIEIDGEVVYDKMVECASDDDGEVLGETPAKTSTPEVLGETPTKTPTPETLPYTAGDSTAGVATLITAATAGIAIFGAVTRRILSSEV